MEANFEALRAMCKNIHMPEGKMTDEYLYTLNAVNLFFYKKNIGQMDIQRGFTDGSNDGGIDFIYSDEDTMYLIQGKSSANLSLDDVKHLFMKMENTIADFENRKHDKYSFALQEAYLNAYDDLTEDKNIALVLFTKTEFDEAASVEIDSFVRDKLCDYKVSVYTDKDIEEREAALFQDSDLVSEDSIGIYPNEEHKRNILFYGEDENEPDGIIVNIRASSLKKLYAKHAAHGLFSYNLREHITQKSVDQGIEETINKERSKFWFYNNGITIGCGDYNIDGNKIKLYNFSIINGAQTTTKVGKAKNIDEQHDFAIVCKIVRAQTSVRSDSDFITRISEASNSQKPIKPRDLKANAREQKALQTGAAKNTYPLAIEIKRGVKPKNIKKVEKWQRVTNEFVGQLIYSCIFQRPGLARNSKNTMFSSGRLYNQLFRRKYDYDTLYDLVRLNAIYKEFAEAFAEQSTNVEQLAVANNGKLSILAAVIYLYKKEKGLIADKNSSGVHQDNITGLLFTDYPEDDLEKMLKGLFKLIIKEISDLYESKKNSERITSYSNFFKSEKMYELVLRRLDERMEDEYDKDKIDSYMKVFLNKKRFF